MAKKEKNLKHDKFVGLGDRGLILDHFLTLLNVSKLENLVHNLNPKPYIIAVTEM